jgi:hypothetical protein
MCPKMGLWRYFPPLHRGRGLATARRLVARAGHPLKVLMVPVASEGEAVDVIRKAVSVLPCRYLLVLGEGILSGVDWLKKALAVDEAQVLALNGGQVPGQRSSCVMVRREWVEALEERDPGG